MHKILLIVLLLFFCLSFNLRSQNSQLQSNKTKIKLVQKKELKSVLENYDFVFAVVKYGGGGDWYEGKVGVIELMRFVNDQGVLNAYPYPVEVELNAYNIYDYPFLYLTGHGNISLSRSEVNKFRSYLERGGFLLVNDDYGIDHSFREEIKKVLPYAKWTSLSRNHPLFRLHFRFSKGVPKVHKHDGGPPEIYAMMINGKMAVLYIKNTDIGDGWAPYQVHKNSEPVRQQAFRFAFNIILFSFLK